jgi:hypothetical protein
MANQLGVFLGGVFFAFVLALLALTLGAVALSVYAGAMALIDHPISRARSVLVLGAGLAPPLLLLAFAAFSRI